MVEEKVDWWGGWNFEEGGLEVWKRLLEVYFGKEFRCFLWMYWSWYEG